ncbi:MAG: hypothetical protein MJ120_04630 [Clostridia bacterium]|nr:hypothetical protein [Clostridia bacterium]
MVFKLKNNIISAKGEVAVKGAELFADEMKKRTDVEFLIKEDSDAAFSFEISDPSDGESFDISEKDGVMVFTAHRLRGLIYAYSMFLRKAVFSDGKIELVKDICGSYTPEMPVRGHQIGYRDANNTYDLWDAEQYRRYFLDIMAFGANVYEGIPGGEDEKNSIMAMSGNEMLAVSSEICKELDLDMSSWHPEEKSRDDETAVRLAVEAYSALPKLDCLFVPGGDPGDLMPHDLFERCRKIKEAVKKYHPNLKMWISAQAPHEYDDWGEKFAEEVKKCPDFLEGVIFGPNHAMTLPELRECVPEKYPLRFYPDVTHNVRCEYPVHFEENDWSYVLASTLSRESINPRPLEYKHLHDIIKEYVCGSVSYSDGINDDVNKIIFSACDFDSSVTAREAIEDYARMYLWETDAKEFADCVFMLEQNWVGHPAQNEGIEKTLSALQKIGEDTPEINENFRYIMCLFRAECDALVRRRFIFESDLVEKAKEKIFAGDVDGAKEILSTDFDCEYKKLREKIDAHAADLNRLIGMQLDVEHYLGKSWERGCTLETIDRPVTDKAFILNLIKNGTDAEKIKKILERNCVKENEVYFSFALDGVNKLTPQVGEFYMDFEGDSPKNNGTIPMCLLNLYDHYSLRFDFDVEANQNYILEVTYFNRKFKENAVDFTVNVNDTELYHGVPYSAEIDEEMKALLPDGYIPAVYKIPAEIVKNGKMSVLIEEPTRGFLVSEFRIIKGE